MTYLNEVVFRYYDKQGSPTALTINEEQVDPLEWAMLRELVQKYG